ncbi:Glu/Leu/Phe/Val dehydrogenase family protein [Aeromicrobium chenweiae]|uniref:Phenylalanine dehydrogenase n=1 Tax=Aeromicrobium chenweiae TaxID=2079793 RepID=A0A2S0WQV2_9ACTN|nr:Glu/Leu/Phe/Val dehydrogenase dimerization domain-containing protein [Aeromicrobium chenweiae]AWB93743.1 phenylalanine dehydrogenase [Aeromicrobium chenweiae]TGN30407.1 Glu/Leu/Phe/Val dehydrogenase [Aeromicrobium chenweiae]
MIENVLTGWDGALCSSRYDRETGAFFTVAVHSRRRGPAAGGTRAMHYASHEDAVADATRLASAMTLKMAAADLPMGGGKSVIALPAPRHEIDDDLWQRILQVHAENLSALNGTYWTGPDVGTTSADMDLLHGRSGFAFGRSVDAGGPGSSAPSTAQGVYVAMRTAAAEAGMNDLAGRRVLVQGLGAVGMDVLELATKDGADVVAADLDEDRCRRARDLGAAIVRPEEVLDVESDVYAPCAMGGVIDVDVARRIRTSVVAGAANNVLVDPAAGEELARRGVVYAPDFIANGGGAIHLVGREVLGWSPAEVASHVDGIAATLSEVFERARTARLSPDRAAHDLAQSRLDRPAA